MLYLYHQQRGKQKQPGEPKVPDTESHIPVSEQRGNTNRLHERDLQDGIDSSKFYSELVGRGMAANTIKLYHNLINPALELAVDSDIIRKNPAKDCKKGIGGTKKERESMTILEQERMLDLVKNSNKYSIYYPMIIF